MLRKIIIVLLFSSLLLNATDIKGRINGTNAISKAPYPLKGISIDLYVEDLGKWIKKDTFLTNSDGMYYFKNVEVGNYTIQVNGKVNYPIEVLNKEAQELAPIIINYK
jgi:hypothetical protein